MFEDKNTNNSRKNSSQLYVRLLSVCTVGFIGLSSFGIAANAEETTHDSNSTINNSSTDKVTTNTAEDYILAVSENLSKTSKTDPVAIPTTNTDVQQFEEPEILIEVKKPEIKETKEEKTAKTNTDDVDQNNSQNTEITAALKVSENKTKNNIDADNDENKDSTTILGFIAPLKTMEKVSDFGYRIHPISGTRKMHNGADYKASCGTAVYAPADGIITNAAWKNSKAGNVINISHTNFKNSDDEIIENVSTNYHHLSNFAVNVGDKVKQGQFIGEIGTTGGSTGCHMHWELQINGVYGDPSSLLNSGKVDQNIYGDNSETWTTGKTGYVDQTYGNSDSSLTVDSSISATDSDSENK